MSNYLKIMPTTVTADVATTIEIGCSDAPPLPAGVVLIADTDRGAPLSDDTIITVTAASASVVPAPITPRGYEYVGRDDDGGWLYRRKGDAS